MQGDKPLGLVHGTTANTSQLLHVRADTKHQPEVHAQSSNIGARLAADPEDTQVAVIVELDELDLVHRPDAELALDGRDERRPLEQRAREELEGSRELGLAAGDLVVEADDGNVLFAGALLGLDEPGGAVDADNQAPRDLWVECAAVTSLFRSSCPSPSS